MLTRKILPLFALLFSFIASASHGQSLDLTDLLNQTESDYNQGLKDGEQIERDIARQAAERARNRDTSNDFCYSIDNEDARQACLGEPYLVSNLRARNILLGNCYAFDSNTDFDRDLQYICSEGKNGCSLLDNSTASYQCNQCGGTRRWLATYSLGTIIQCFK